MPFSCADACVTSISAAIAGRPASNWPVRLRSATVTFFLVATFLPYSEWILAADI